MKKGEGSTRDQGGGEYQIDLLAMKMYTPETGILRHIRRREGASNEHALQSQLTAANAVSDRSGNAVSDRSGTAAPTSEDGTLVRSLASRASRSCRACQTV